MSLTTTGPELRLRSISELLGERFFVPTYQRGYRWTARQVEALLNDLADFQLRERRPEAYYCLQPVVVRRRPGGEWELIDGQQRLTTISLILRALDDVAKMLTSITSTSVSRRGRPTWPPSTTRESAEAVIVNLAGIVRAHFSAPSTAAPPPGPPGGPEGTAPF